MKIKKVKMLKKVVRASKASTLATGTGGHCQGGGGW